MPHIAVTGDDGITLVLQFRSGGEEGIPAAGTGANLFTNECGIISTPDVLGDGAAIDESTAGSLIAEADQFTVGRAGADLNSILCDVGSFNCSGNVDAQIFVSGSVFSSVALCIFQNESGFCSIDVSFAGGKHLVQSRLVQTVGGGGDGGVHFIFVSEVRMSFEIFCDHARDFISEGHDIDDGFAVSRRAHSEGQNHAKSKSKNDKLFHYRIPPLINKRCVR